MTLSIKPGNLLDEQEFEEFKKTLLSRQQEGSAFAVNLEETLEMNLSRFNALVKLYVVLRRANKHLTYSHLTKPVAQYANKTRFDHVFVK